MVRFILVICRRPSVIIENTLYAMCLIQFDIVDLPVFCEKLSRNFTSKIVVVFALHCIAV